MSRADDSQVSPPPGGPAGGRYGLTFEETVGPCLQRNGYSFHKQTVKGVGLGGGSQRTDKSVITPGGDKILVSLKWQQAKGTVDEKVPYETVKLLSLMEQYPEFKRAYIVIGGDGFRPGLLNFYLSGKLQKWIPDAYKVTCMTLNQFIAACNKKAL